MAKKAPGKARIYLEYAAVVVCSFVLGWLPLFLTRRVAFLLGDAWRGLNKKHRRLAFDQITDRLGYDAPRAHALVKANYRHYALFVVEAARLKRLSLAAIRRSVDANGGDAIMREALSRGKGLIAVTGHLGNWEWGAVVLGMFDVAEGLIARPLDNPLIDDMIKKVRERTGSRVWDKYGCMRKALTAIRNGRGFVAVMDQDAGSRGYRAPFLGKDSSTMGAPVELAVKTGAPIYVGALIRNPSMDGFTLVSRRVHWPREGADPEEEKLRLATEVNEDLSSIIREYPEQWIWIHRRWKSQPKKSPV